jgi:hypothetical protein
MFLENLYNTTILKWFATNSGKGDRIMNREQRRKETKAGKGKDLYNEVTGKKSFYKEIPVSELKVDESKLDQQLLQKMTAYENIKDSLERDVGRYGILVLNYLDSLCTIPFELLDKKDEVPQVISIIDFVNDYVKNMLEGMVLSEENLEKTIESIKDVAKFSLQCFKGTDIPLLTPICERTVQLIDYSYVIGSRIGVTLGFHSMVDKFTQKDIEYIKEYSEFLTNKSLEIKSKN